jgi:hypothetical protein
MTTVTRSFKVTNKDSKAHDYSLSANVHYADFDPALTSVTLSTSSFSLAPKKSKRVKVQLTLDPSKIGPDEQEYGWYDFLASQDGAVKIKQSKHGNDTLNVPWHVVPNATSQTSLDHEALDVSGGSDSMAMNTGGAGTDQADLYLLGATDPVNSTGEEDITAVGARSFTGNSVNDDDTENVPDGTDPLTGSTWQEFLTNDDTPSEPVEFGVQTADVHNTTETNEVDVLVDSGTLGDFADPELKADYLVAKLGNPDTGGPVCVFDLSQPDPFSDCSALYFGDYSVYNSNVYGLVVDANSIGVTNADPEITYQVTDCTGRFSGDAPNTAIGEPAQFCDTAGGFDDDSGTYTAKLNVTDPELDISPLTCGGFFGGGACDAGNPITVSNGSAAPGDDPGILALFPNNKPSRTPTVVDVNNGP